MNKVEHNNKPLCALELGLDLTQGLPPTVVVAACHAVVGECVGAGHNHCPLLHYDEIPVAEMTQFGQHFDVTQQPLMPVTRSGASYEVPAIVLFNVHGETTLVTEMACKGEPNTRECLQQGICRKGRHSPDMTRCQTAFPKPGGEDLPLVEPQVMKENVEVIVASSQAPRRGRRQQLTLEIMSLLSQ